MNTITIDLKTYVHSPKLYSRLIWQELYCIYRNSGGSPNHMDNLLCDLYTLERELAKGKGISLYWDFDVSGYTDMKGYHHPKHYHILWDGLSDNITIRFVKEKKEDD